jgi:ribosome-binding factor A
MDANIPKSERQLKVEQQVLGIVQDFFQRESSGLSMITVTRTDITRDMRHGTIFITVLPEDKEEAAINFAKRMRSDLRHYVMKRLPVKVIPFFEVEIDYGEKNRVHIDKLLKEEASAMIRASGKADFEGTDGEYLPRQNPQVASEKDDN